MTNLARVTLCLGLLLTAANLNAQELPQAQVTPEHEWIKQFVGEWENDILKGTTSARMLGDIWVIVETKASIGGKTLATMLTLGYDPQRKKYVGTWVDSTTSHLWTYEGTVDETGKILTLEAEGPNPLMPGKLFKYRDVYEFKSKDHKVLTSTMQGADGKWQTFQTVNYKRKK